MTHDDYTRDMPAIAESLGLSWDGPPPLDDADAPPDQHAPPGDAHQHHGGGRSARDLVLATIRRCYQVGRTIDERPYIVPVRGPNYALTSGQAKASVARRVAEATGRAPGRSPLDEAWTVIEGEAMEQPKTELPLRVADDGASCVLDLGSPNGRCAVVHPNRWELRDRSPATFKRTKATASLPDPVHGGDWSQLWRVVHIDPADRDLVRGWLVAALRRRIPHPILKIGGEQGATKTTATKYLGRLIDPSAVDVLAPPRDMARWEVAVNARWVIPVDNVSNIDAAWSDALCRTATGAGVLDRALYTDDDVSAKHMRGCVILNGITIGGSLRSDLAERLLPIGLHRPVEYLGEVEVEAVFEGAWPALVGVLLTDLAATLAALPGTPRPRDLRMADFAHTLAAFDAATGSTATRRYRQLVDDAAGDALESDLFARCIVELMQQRDTWTGTASELLAALDRILEAEEWHPARRRDRDTPDWPQRPNEVRNWLARSESNLRFAGVRFQQQQRTNSARMYRFERAEQ